MKRTLRILILPALGVPVAVAGALLATQPWDDETAGGQATEFRLCNLVYTLPPEDSQFQIRPLAFDVFYDGRPILVVDVKRARSGTDPQTGESRIESPGLVVDAETGDVLDEQSYTASDKAALEELLTTIQPQPFDPAEAPWPYSDATSAPVERRSVSAGGPEIRWPDPLSGIFLSQTTGAGSSPSDRLSTVNLQTCKSSMRIDLLSGDVLKQDVDPDDEAAFETFRAEAEASVR